MSLNKLKPRQTRYGWHPDLPDSRDLLYSAPRALRLPPSADLRHWCSPVEDQGQLGSCTANALAGALELLENKDKDAPFADLSRLFIYYNERVLEHSVASDSGAQLRDGVKALAKLGACKESLWPYAIAKFAAKPSLACYKDAAKRVISAYRRLSGLAQMKPAWRAVSRSPLASRSTPALSLRLWPRPAPCPCPLGAKRCWAATPCWLWAMTTRQAACWFATAGALPGASRATSPCPMPMCRPPAWPAISGPLRRSLGHLETAFLIA